MRWPPFTPQEDSWYSFLLEAESTSVAVRIRSNEKKKNHLIHTQTHDLPVCSISVSTNYATTCPKCIGNCMIYGGNVLYV
jgi:hypothetical protein